MHMLVGSCPGSPSFSWKTLVSQVLWARWLYGQCCKELFAASLMARDMGHGKNHSWLMSSGITRTIFEENHNPCGETLLLTNQDSYKGRTLDFEQRSCHMICFHMKGGGSQSSHVRTPSRRNPIPFGGMSISATKNMWQLLDLYENPQRRAEFLRSSLAHGNATNVYCGDFTINPWYFLFYPLFIPF